MAEMVSSPRMPSQERVLTIYLNDHLAAATAGVDLAKRSAGSNAGTEFGEFLHDFAELIARADEQHAGLERHHTLAIESMLAAA